MADMFDEIAKALGHLVLAFNDLEVALGGALMYLLKQDEEVGAAFIAHLGAATKIRLLQHLDRRIEDENTRYAFRGLVQRAAEINVERNRYIHSEYWSVPATEPYRHASSVPAQREQAGGISNHHRRAYQGIRQRRERGGDHGPRERRDTTGHALAATVRASALTHGVSAFRLVGAA